MSASRLLERLRPKAWREEEQALGSHVRCRAAAAERPLAGTLSGASATLLPAP